MSFFEVLMIGVGLSMDAFAVSVCKGLAMKKCMQRFVHEAGNFKKRIDYWGVFRGLSGADAAFGIFPGKTV